MQRIFTLVFSCIVFTSILNAQCTTPATCAVVSENFNLDAGGFVGSEGFVYNNTDGSGPLGNFQAVGITGNNTPPKEKIVSPDYAGANPAIIGFTSAGVSGTYTINVRNAITDVIIATCAVAVTGTSTTYCRSFSSAAIASSSVYFELIFDNANGSPGSGTLTLDDFRTNLAEAINLPVSFISFNAQKVSNSTQLTWKVGEEDNVKGYEIERSTDGTNFTSVGFVAASGKSTYTYNDAQSTQGTVFYRIRNVDNDGKFKYSNILSLKNGASSLVLRAFPLPALSKLTVQHEAAFTNGKINIASSDGSIVKRIILTPGSLETTVNLVGLKSGIYILQFDSGNGKTQTMKFMKQ